MSKRTIPAGAVVRGTDKGYDHEAPKPGSERPITERPVDPTHEDKKYPYLRPRDAATLILVRQRGKIPEVLLGCRDAKHAFMPNRYVFPGGRVDPDDARVPVATPLDRFVDERLRKAATAQRARALAVAAVMLCGLYFCLTADQLLINTGPDAGLTSCHARNHSINHGFKDRLCLTIKSRSIARQR